MCILLNKGGWRLVVVGCQLAVVGYQLAVASWQLSVASCGLPVASSGDGCTFQKFEPMQLFTGIANFSYCLATSV
jgi:hypothetical protein